MGGWRYDCNFCAAGRGLKSFPRKAVADRALGNHAMTMHAHKTEVRALMQSTTEAAHAVEASRDEVNEFSKQEGEGVQNS